MYKIKDIKDSKDRAAVPPVGLIGVREIMETMIKAVEESGYGPVLRLW